MSHIKSFTVYKSVHEVVTDGQRSWKEFDTCNYSHFLVLTCNLLPLIRDRSRKCVTDCGRSQHISTERGFCLVQDLSRSPQFGSTMRCAVWSFTTMQYNLMRWLRLKISHVDSRKFLDRPKILYDQHCCHNWPQDLIRSDTSATISTWWRLQDFNSGAYRDSGNAAFSKVHFYKH